MDVVINFKVIGGFAGALYISASLFLWRFPTLLHRKKHFKFRSQHISHRGGAAENLENTMGAFRHAVNLGTDMLELDCQLTKDKKVVVLHEPNLLRLTGLNENVQNLLFKDIPLLKPELWLHFDAHHIAKGSDRKIALLEDVFREFPDVAINIDLKEGHEDLLVEVDRLIRKYNRAELCIWGNRQESIGRRCYDMNPDVPVLFSLRKVFFVVFAFYIGLLPFIPLREGFFEIPYSSIYLDLMPPSSSLYDQLIRLTCHLMDFFIFNRFLFKHFERRGIRVLPWVLQHPDQFEFVFKKGVHGVMTDFPTRLNDYLESKGMRESNNNKCSGDAKKTGGSNGSGVPRKRIL